MKSKGRTKSPTFYNDYDADNYELMLIGWAKKRGIYKTNDEIFEQAKRNIKALIYDRSKTDFIELTPEQVQLIRAGT